MTSFRDYLLGNKKLLHDNRNEFGRIFGTSLDTYWDKITGFDICGFDQKFIKSQFEESCEDAIRRKYGDEAVALVWRLLGKQK